MSANSPISWTQDTLNPTTGCDKVSAGCRNCYAERLALRLQAMGNPSYVNGFQVTLQPRMLDRPLQWREPRRIFVNSMSDLFHDAVPLAYIKQVFDMMEKANWHQFQVLTKRAERLAAVAPELPWPANVWMGVSVEDDRVRRRIGHLQQVPAAVRFISAEPLLGPLHDLDLTGIGWVIAGGESGPGARPMDLDWARDLRDQSVRAGIPFHFKQVGGVRKWLTGRLLDGRTWDEFPA